MPGYTTRDIRNIALVGDAAGGKTMLAERLLFATGTIGAMGEVVRGSTVSDFDPQEKSHQRSLTASVLHCESDGRQLNIIDTPGYPDFLGAALSVLPAVETAAVVVDARLGVQTVTRRVMESAKAHGVCRLLIVNKIDADDVDLAAVLSGIAEAFGDECLPINLPADGGSRVVDCFFSPSGDATDILDPAQAHTQIVDQVVEMDEALMEAYLEEGEDLAPERLHDAFELALREGHLVPVCFVSAESGAGIDELLKVITTLMPSPTEGNRPHFSRGDDETAAVEVTGSPDGHALAHVFKVTIDNFVGRLGVFRIHQGTVTKDTQLFADDARKPFKVAHLLKLQGKDHSEIDAGVPGDICAVAKIDELMLDTVLHDSHDEDDIRMQSVSYPSPMYGLAVTARNRGDQQKISDALQKLDVEDPCFRVEHNSVTNETVIKGLGDLHLRVVLEKMNERYNVEVDTHTPKIEYRETIRSSAEGHARHKKQTGGAGQFGEVYIKLEPSERGAGFEFIDKIVGGVIPHQFIPAVEKGVRQVLDTGAVAGYPLQDVRVTLYDGKFHPVDSKEVAFIAAGKKAFIEAVSKANPVVLEPIVNVDITVPQDNMGDIAGDLSSKRGRINGTEASSQGMVTISGQVPLGEMENYQSQLKSVTGGEGSYNMELSHYDPVPALLQKRLTEEFKPSVDDD
jgi:elongation factor G